MRLAYRVPQSLNPALPIKPTVGQQCISCLLPAVVLDRAINMQADYKHFATQIIAKRLHRKTCDAYTGYDCECCWPIDETCVGDQTFQRRLAESYRIADTPI